MEYLPNGPSELTLPIKRGRGRPKGSKNKPKEDRSSKLILDGKRRRKLLVHRTSIEKRRGPGRPKGSKNKPKGPQTDAFTIQQLVDHVKSTPPSSSHPTGYLPTFSSPSSSSPTGPGLLQQRATLSSQPPSPPSTPEHEEKVIFPSHSLHTPSPSAPQLFLAIKNLMKDDIETCRSGLVIAVSSSKKYMREVLASVCSEILKKAHGRQILSTIFNPPAGHITLRPTPYKIAFDEDKYLAIKFFNEIAASLLPQEDCLVMDDCSFEKIMEISGDLIVLP
jgi:hypothetical protein